MVDRKIVLTDCQGCPSLGHKGAFGSIGYVPVCRAVLKEQPYTTSVMGGGLLTLCRTPGIPDWCPLPHNAEITGDK